MSEVIVALDYIIFALTLCISASIGIYFGCFGSKQKTATEYLFGKGSMKTIPVGLSLFSSAISVVTVIGTPGEMYTFGSQFFITFLGMLLSSFITWCFILPVFCGGLKIQTPYEYFELRFNFKVCLLATGIYIMHAVFILPVILYGATISFSELSQISLPVCTTIIGGVCIIYTMLGGFAAVIWSDTLQATLMLGACVLVMIKGILNVGGISEIFYRVEQGNRLTLFDMNPNPFKRLTFWSALIGMCFHYGSHSGCSASSIQRYMSVKSEKQARISTCIGCFGAFFVGIIVCIIGLTMFAQYHDCDPVKNKEVSGYNKLFPYYIAHTVQDIPGFLGLFLAGILSAGLSTISAELNIVSGLLYHCLFKRIFKTSFDESAGAIIMKILVLVVGLYTLTVAPFLDKFQHLSAFSLGINSISYGSILGMIILGTTLPNCNSIGLAAGSISGIILTGWISFGSLYYNINDSYILPFSTENCAMKINFTDVTHTLNTTITTLNLSQLEDIPLFYRLSYMHYVPFGTFVTIIIALIVSYITGGNDINKIDPNMLIPWMRPKNKKIYDFNMIPAEEIEKLNVAGIR